MTRTASLSDVQWVVAFGNRGPRIFGRLVGQSSKDSQYNEVRKNLFHTCWDSIQLLLGGGNMKRNWLWICVILVMGWVAVFSTPSMATADMSAHKNIVDVVTYRTVGDWFSPHHYGAPKFQSLYNHTYYRYAEEDWGWQHQWDVPDNCHLRSANLRIRAFDVDYPVELDLLYGDGQYVGTLTGEDDKWRWCDFDLMPIQDQLNDGELNLWLDIDHDAIGAAVGVWKSRLVLKYDCDYKEPIHTPAPGAALLAFCGVSFVGWLRRTRSSLFE